jgi:pimeloyl-ACP methyl ester carboxylesterase
MLTFVLLVLAVVLLVALGGAAWQAAESAADTSRFPPPGRLVNLGLGRRLHVRCTGHGEPAVILESGIAASSLSWALVQPRVAEFTQVCSYDRAGLGWSDAGGSPVTAADHAAALHALLDAMKLPPPYVLAGHSYGGFVNRLFAERYPHEVAGIVLVDPIAPAEWATPSGAEARRLRGGVFLSRVGSVLARLGVVRFCLNLLAGGATTVPRRVARLFGAEAAGVLGNLVGEVQKLPPDTWPLVRRCWSQHKCFDGMANHLAGLPASAREVGVSGPLGNIPLTVISAGRQPAASLDARRVMTTLSSRGRLVVAAESGHWIHLDEPDVVVAAIRALVEDARKSRT